MATSKMGYETYLAYGAAGSQASNQLLYATDTDYDVGVETGETTSRGDGSAPPIVYKRVTSRVPKITFKMTNKGGDTNLAALLAAARAGTPVAIYYKDTSAGKGFDGDVILTSKHLGPLKGEQTYEFSCEANDDSRAASLNAS